MGYRLLHELVLGGVLAVSFIFVWRNQREQLRKPLFWIAAVLVSASFLLGPFSAIRGDVTWKDDVAYCTRAFAFALAGCVAAFVWFLTSRKVSGVLLVLLSGWLSFLWFFAMSFAD